MKKEVVLAILIGLTMGLIITYGVYRVQTSFDPEPSEVTQETELQNADQETATVIAIHSPEEGIIQTETTTTVAGTTIPNSFVVIFVNDTEQITTSDESGNFSSTVNLETGPNVIKVHVVEESGNTYSQERLVMVSELFEQEDAQTATDSAQIEDDN